LAIGVPIPPPINQTKKCDRCGLHYSVNETDCIHCKDLSDNEVIELIERINHEQHGNANLGKFFIYVAILIIIGMLIIANT